MRQLATVQTITDIQPIPDADAIEVASVLGWKVVIKKGEFNIGDRIVYCEVDSIMPERPEFEFLRPVKFRVKTRRMRGQISQGIVFPLSVLTTTPKSIENKHVIVGMHGSELKILYQPEIEFELDSNDEPNAGPFTMVLTDGLDVTDFLGVIKYDIPEEDTGLTVNGQGGRSAMKRGFPNWIPKTDETRIQSVPRVLEDAVGTGIYITEKLDGSSYTCFLKDNEFGVCSRNQEKKEIPTCHFWEATRRLGIEEKLREYKQKTGIELALQGELVGPGIQKNKYGLVERSIYFFNAFKVATGSFVDYAELLNIVLDLDVNLVPLLFLKSGTKIGDPGFSTVDDFIKLSTMKTNLYPQSVWAEGIVVRPLVESTHRKLGRFSFKAINPEFLLKYD